MKRLTCHFKVSSITDIDKLSYAIYETLFSPDDTKRKDVVTLISMGDRATVRAVKAVAVAESLAKREGYSLISTIEYSTVRALDSAGEEIDMTAIEISVSYG